MSDTPLQSVAAAAGTPITAPSRFPLRLGLACIAVILGDWLFFERRPGISLVVFMSALAMAPPILSERSRRDTPTAAAILAIAFLPLIEAPSLLSLLIAAVGLALFVVWTQSSERDLAKMADAAAAFLLTAPFQFLPDIARAHRDGQLHFRLSSLYGWVLPIGFCTAFVWLFASANPLIQAWLEYLSPLQLISGLSATRIGLWLLLLFLAWPVIAPRLLTLRTPRDAFAGGSAPEAATIYNLLAPTAILRSLVLFNAMFAVQTVMDLTYLWGGLDLPDGMSHAEYAHRGAYPLIATALLAAAFVLIAMRPGEERSPLVRGLVHLWVGQNVLLVISSILRLSLYVEFYSLTYLRVAAFIWMMLVAIGLVLIMLRIAQGRSNEWLIGANLKVLAVVLYGCALVNFAGLIASYNVDHDRRGNGLRPDFEYLLSLGPDAIPALDKYAGRLDRGGAATVLHSADEMAHRHARAMRDWRAWSFRGERLNRYIETRGFARLPEERGWRGE